MGLISKAAAAKILGRDQSKISRLIERRQLRDYKPPGKLAMVEEDDIREILKYQEKGVEPPIVRMHPIEPIPVAAEKPSRSQAPAAPPQPREKKKPSEVTEDDFDLFDSAGRLDSGACRAWGEYEKSRKLQIERLALEGEYVLAAEVGPRFERAMLTIQNGVMSAPSRLKALCPDTPQSTMDALERLLIEALEKAVVDSVDAN